MLSHTSTFPGIPAMLVNPPERRIRPGSTTTFPPIDTLLFSFQQRAAQDGHEVTTITTLPVELLIEILKEVEFMDVLHIRQTCKSLVEVTTAKPIWTNLLWECERSSPGILTLEKPADLYSSKELEHLVLVWESTRIGWRTADDTPSRQRTIHLDQSSSYDSCPQGSRFYEAVYLVPGGRWLLVLYIGGGIAYYDLDSTQYEDKRILVPDCTRHTVANGDVVFAVDIPDRLPMRCFKLAQYIRGYCDTDGTQYPCIKIWSIEFVVEGQVVTGMRADCLRTLFVNSANCRMSVSLRGEYLAFVVRGPYPTPFYVAGKPYVFVVDWICVEDRSWDYPRRILYTDEPKEIHLLSNERLVAVVRSGVWVYDFSSLDSNNAMPEVTPPPPTIVSPTSLLKYSLPLNVGFSAPLSSRDNTTFLALADPALHSITVSDDFGTPRSSESGFKSIRELMVVPIFDYCDKLPGPRYCLGRRHGILQRMNRETQSTDLILLEYHPTERIAPDYVPVVKSIPIPCRNFNCLHEVTSHNLLLDEGSGRAIAPLNTHFEVVDFALVHKRYQHTA
ncbi:hypothetical protein D9613_000046 [Agrocybe pediades]|uniref:F-box domain-containing protein n=1 Tax=Agrocybe pediades TaxID=84607 RepID=A0A8H4VV50_9AGAR|nr:hypothetical protein D9613_000046 [Agrocybe pediades]